MRLAMTERRTLAGSVVLGLVVAAARIATGISIALAISRVLEGAPIGEILPWLVLAVALVGLRAACNAIQEGVMAGASVRITADLRHRLVDRIMRLGPGWVTEERSGELEAVLVDGVESSTRTSGCSSRRRSSRDLGRRHRDRHLDRRSRRRRGRRGLRRHRRGDPPVEYRALGSHMRFWSESYRPLAAEFVDGLQGWPR
jgi:hypothetical protein